MPRVRGYFPFVTLGKYAYAIGGYDDTCLKKVDKFDEEEGWSSVADLPYEVS